MAIKKVGRNNLFPTDLQHTTKAHCEYLYGSQESGFVLTLSKLAHRQDPKRSHVGVGGLEVRGRQRLALTSVR